MIPHQSHHEVHVTIGFERATLNVLERIAHALGHEHDAREIQRLTAELDRSSASLAAAVTANTQPKKEP